LAAACLYQQTPRPEISRTHHHDPERATVEALGVVRAVKPRIGMGVEFLDWNRRLISMLERWIEQSRRER